jgi:hypothetical protein
MSGFATGSFCPYQPKSKTTDLIELPGEPQALAMPALKSFRASSLASLSSSSVLHVPLLSVSNQRAKSSY